MLINGKVIRYGDNIDTDIIIPARYLNTHDRKQLASHCMEDLDSEFAEKTKTRNIIAAGSNFGCGSSREHAPIAILESGISCIVAKSFARIFYRNAINIGLPIVECDMQIDDGDTLEVDFTKGVIRNETKNTEFSFPPFSEAIQKIISSGGLLNSLKN